MVLAVKWSRLLRIRRRSRMDKKTMFMHGWNMIWECEKWVEDNTNITSRVCRSKNDIGWHGKSRIRYFLENCLARPMCNNSVLDWLREREEVSWHPSCNVVDGSFEMSYFKREVDCRKWDEKLSVIQGRCELWKGALDNYLFRGPVAGSLDHPPFSRWPKRHKVEGHKDTSATTSLRHTTLWHWHIGVTLG